MRDCHVPTSLSIPHLHIMTTKNTNILKKHKTCYPRIAVIGHVPILLLTCPLHTRLHRDARYARNAKRNCSTRPHIMDTLLTCHENKEQTHTSDKPNARPIMVGLSPDTECNITRKHESAQMGPTLAGPYKKSPDVDVHLIGDLLEWLLFQMTPATEYGYTPPSLL